MKNPYRLILKHHPLPQNRFISIRTSRQEDMSVAELQSAILAKMANNGPVSDQMKKTVNENIWHDSLVNWLKSFR